MKDWALRLHRWRLLRNADEDPLVQFASRPLPASSTSFVDAELLCLDMETTGLDANHAEVLSVGWVVIRDARIDLATAESYVVKPKGGVGDSATVHGLTDTMVGAGTSLDHVLQKTLEVLGSRVLVVHHAGLDKALLDRLCLERYGARLPIPVIDTMQLEHRRQTRQHHTNGPTSLRLVDLRKDYHLPHYASHNCLTDAIATGELLLAIVANCSEQAAVTLRKLYS